MDELNSRIYTAEERVKSEGTTQDVTHRERAVNMKEKLSYMEGITNKYNTPNLSSRRRK